MSTNLPVENIQPFFFNGNRLYGCYQAALGRAQDAVVVLCNAFGDESLRAHRAYRQLAIRLNRAGFPVMRFDYYGTGDSAGEDSDGTLAQWRLDAQAAVDEAKRRAGVSKVILSGLRLGASLAAQVASQRQDVLNLALWEPIVDGAAYLTDLREAHEHKLFYLASGPAAVKTERPTELLGYDIAPALFDELQMFDLLKLADKPSNSILVVEQGESAPIQKLRSHLESLGARVAYQSVDDPVIWAEDPDKALVPHNVLQAIVGWVGA